MAFSGKREKEREDIETMRVRGERQTRGKKKRGKANTVLLVRNSYDGHGMDTVQKNGLSEIPSMFAQGQPELLIRNGKWFCSTQSSNPSNQS